ncbi:bifunctional lysine-specific demethylase and histidyl-hydroxylase NO66 [Drosophila ficusphila]|uniref:bifunctional lysine-specific demethylase and histidyl-hydroxylase NO66 n=1 Tax=Drosophila ficusphila TaxID=30025 RepID=UPI001C899708|nr:bifunctional lysine-specific demethylase and histidyl-hydroxylase NO66 [Drosophila ficusphila]
MSKDLQKLQKAGKKAKELSPSCVEDLANQLFDKSKLMSLSIKEQRKLLQEYLSSKIEDSDKSDEEEQGESDSNDSDSTSDEDDSSFSECCAVLFSDTDDGTESSYESSSEAIEDEEDSTKSLVPFQMPKKIVKVSPSYLKNREYATNSEEQIPEEESLKTNPVNPRKSSPKPSSRIQRRLTMVGGLVAPRTENSSKSKKIKSIPIMESQMPIEKRSVNDSVKSKGSGLFKEIPKPIIRLADPRS